MTLLGGDAKYKTMSSENYYRKIYGVEYQFRCKDVRGPLQSLMRKYANLLEKYSLFIVVRPERTTVFWHEKFSPQNNGVSI